MSFYGDYDGPPPGIRYSWHRFSWPRPSRILGNSRNERRRLEYDRKLRYGSDVRKLRNTGSGRKCMVYSVCFLMVLSLVAVGASVTFLVMRFMEKDPQLSTYQTWDSWTDWGACNASCGPGSQTRHRLCTKISAADVDHTMDNYPACEKVGGLGFETLPCSLQNCTTEDDDADVDGFTKHAVNEDGTSYIYTCNDTSYSIQVGSGSDVCPVMNLDPSTNEWSTFNATCGQAREDDQSFAQYGGSYFGLSGYVTSPLHPLPYPDVNAAYHWTLASNGSDIQFRLLTLATDYFTGSCTGRSSLSIYCGIDIPTDTPSFGPFCGSTSQRLDLVCNSTCALVQFESHTRAHTNATGFHITWKV